MSAAPRFALGVDLGGTRLRAAAMTESGEIIAREEMPTEVHGGPDRILADILRLVEIVSAGIPADAIAGLCVCAPGPLDARNGIALHIPTLPGFDDFPLAAVLGEKLPYPVSLENDGIAAAVAEWRYGAGRGVDNLVYMTVSTGIGGGVIADGRVLYGRMGMAGHIGHMSIRPDGNVCPCGNAGCFEAYGSGTAFTARGRVAAARRRDSSLSRYADSLHARDIFAAAREGDALARDLVAEEAETLGQGVRNLLHLYSPDLVVIGGGIANAFDQLEGGIRAYIAARALPPFRTMPIRRAELGDLSGVVGTAALAFAHAKRKA